MLKGRCAIDRSVALQNAIYSNCYSTSFYCTGMIEWHTCTYRVSSAHLLIAQRYEPALHLQGLRQTYHSDSVLTTGLDRSVVANGRSDVCRSAAVGSGERGIVEAGRDTSGEQRREEEEGRGARPSWKAKLVRFLKALYVER